MKNEKLSFLRCNSNRTLQEHGCRGHVGNRGGHILVTKKHLAGNTIKSKIPLDAAITRFDQIGTKIS